MGRLWSCGFELQSMTAGVEVESITGSPTINTTTHRAGGLAAMSCSPSTATPTYVYNTFQADTINTHYERFYFYIGVGLSANAHIWQYRDSTNGIGMVLQLTTANVLQFIAYNNNQTTPRGATTGTLSTSAWHKVELKYTDDANTAAVFEWYVDDVLIATNTGLTGINGAGRSALGIITAATGTILFDDWGINDTSGSVQNGYPGSGNIVHVYPATAGDSANWTPLTSTNVSQIDEFPTPDDATSYNQIMITGAIGTLSDSFGMRTPTQSGIGSNDTVRFVQVGIRGGSTSTTSGASISATLKSAAGGTKITAAAKNFNVNGWRTHGQTPYQYQITSYTDPTTGSAWTVAGTNSITNMQVGYTNGASNTTVRRVTTVWALVEIVPSTTQTYPVASAMTASSLVNAAITNTAPAASAMSGMGAMAGSDNVITSMAAAMSGAGSMSAAIQTFLGIASAMSGAGSMSAALSPNVDPSAAAISGAGSMTGAITDTTAVAATMAGVGSMVAALNQTESGAAAMAGSGVMGQTNLINNPSFESDALGAIPAGWSNANNSGTTSYKGVANDVVQYGSKSAKIAASSSAVQAFNQNVSLQTGKTYTLSAYVTTDANVTNAGIFAFDNGFANEKHVAANASGRISLTFTVTGTGVVTISLGLGYYTGGASPGTVWFDGIMLQQTTASPVYSEGGPAVPFSITEPVAAAMSGAGSMSSSIIDVEPVSASASGSSSVVAAITDTTYITSAMSGVGSMTPTLGAVTTNLAAAETGTSGGSASMSNSTTLAANAAGSGSMSAIIKVTEMIAAAMSGAGSMVGSINATDPMSASMSGSGSMTVMPTNTTSLQVALSGQSSASAALQNKTTIAAAMSGAGTMTPVIKNTTYVSAAITALSNMTAVIANTVPTISASMSGSSSMVATVKETEFEASAMAGAGSMSAVLLDITTIVASMSGAGSMSSDILDIAYITATINDAYGDMTAIIRAASPEAFIDHRRVVNLRQVPHFVHLTTDGRPVSLTSAPKTAYVKQI